MNEQREDETPKKPKYTKEQETEEATLYFFWRAHTDLLLVNM